MAVGAVGGVAGLGRGGVGGVGARAMALLTSAAVAGCGSDSGSFRAGRFRVHDSAGIEIAGQGIAESAIASGQKLRLVEELRIGGGLEGGEAEQFYTLGAIDVGPEGEIVVLDAGEYKVRVFSSSGESLRSWGRQGEGPGDFQSPSRVAMARDTIAIEDQTRVHFFDAGGAFLNSATVGGRSGGYWVGDLLATEEGWVVGVRSQKTAAPGRERAPTEVHYLDPGSGELGRSIVTYHSQPEMRRLASGGFVDPAFSQSVHHGVD